jgi:starch synthase (maltosyl-transferring)
VSSAEGRRRAVIEAVRPEVDCGRFAVKRVVGETVTVEASAFADGHDQLACVLRYRRAGDRDWREAPMSAHGNDRWRGEFTVAELGRYQYGIVAWVDAFLSWRHDFARREDEEDIERALRTGAKLLAEAAQRAQGDDRRRLSELASGLAGSAALALRREQALAVEVEELARRYPDRRFETTYDRELEVVVDRELARCGAWYEFFPRSTTDGVEAHGTLRGAMERLADIAEMGFDVVYLPPVHPIGRTNRKGPNNALQALPEDPGSPWAIGAEDGGHKAMHPMLGGLEDFRALCERAQALGLEVALDIAFQCAPDHPYVTEHPDWFRHRPDGSVQYAENPPKKYEDIYPFDFESDDWQGLWAELESVVEFWIGQGVRIFRVDNPHTKPFPFWEWLIGRVKTGHPDVIFLSEAFTRPPVMHRLAKLGFSQSYTYFTWRNTKRELIEYLTELSSDESREYLRPNLWPNTPDILHEYLQFGGRPAFMARVTLAATLGANYGIYGPVYELLERTPREPGSEEYLNSEKYQIRAWDLARPDSLCDFISRLNAVRRENTALQSDWTLRFHPVDNEELIAYSKHAADWSNIILVIVNLDAHHTQSGFVEVPLDAWGLEGGQPYQVHDLLSGARYLWHGARNYVELDPRQSAAHVFRLRRRLATERDFDYYM